MGNPLDPTVFNISQVETLPITASELQAATCADPILGKVLNYVRQQWPHHTSACLQPYKRNCQELAIEGDCLF